MLKDSFGRQINYLRMAVTDRCNIRCQYCMPEKMTFSNREELLTYEELLRISNLLTAKSITKIRITGGEPFVRKDLMPFLNHLSQLEGLRSLHITSNGSLLEPYIQELEKININSINLSLDTLDESRYFAITKRNTFNKVWTVLNQLLESTIQLKINMVVMRGVNESDIIPMSEFVIHQNVEVRYIEEMPFNGSDKKNEPINHHHIYNRLLDHYGELNKLDNLSGDTSVKYQVPGAVGSLGIIAAHTRTFCGSCNRIRLTPQGELINCLYNHKGLNIKYLIRDGISDEQLISMIQDHIEKKHIDGHTAEAARSNKQFQSMSLIGG